VTSADFMLSANKLYAGTTVHATGHLFRIRAILLEDADYHFMQRSLPCHQTESSSLAY